MPSRSACGSATGVGFAGNRHLEIGQRCRPLRQREADRMAAAPTVKSAAISSALAHIEVEGIRVIRVEQCQIERPERKMPARGLPATSTSPCPPKCAPVFESKATRLFRAPRRDFLCIECNVRQRGREGRRHSFVRTRRTPLATCSPRSSSSMPARPAGAFPPAGAGLAAGAEHRANVELDVPSEKRRRSASGASTATRLRTTECPSGSNLSSATSIAFAATSAESSLRAIASRSSFGAPVTCQRSRRAVLGHERQLQPRRQVAVHELQSLWQRRIGCVAGSDNASRLRSRVASSVSANGVVELPASLNRAPSIAPSQLGLTA